LIEAMICLRAPTSPFSAATPELQAGNAARIAAFADRLGFGLLLLAVSALLIRPADLLPALGGAPIYESLVVACMVAALPRLVEQLTLRSLRENSITAFVLLMIPAVMLSHLAHLDIYGARVGGVTVAKGCLLFLLVVGLVNSPGRLRCILWVVATCVLFEAFLAILQYRGMLHLAALQNIVQTTYNSETGQPTVLIRLCGIGLFNDPNDFSLVLVVAMVLCVYGLDQPQLGRARFLFLGPLAILGYALFLTHSRGGVIAATGAMLVFLPARFGWRNTLPLACLLVPVLILSFWGRATHVDITNPEDTFQTRLELWNGSLDQFCRAPLFGIGQGALLDELGQVSHNSYLHAYTEMGLLGGTAFVGAFYLILRGLKASEATGENALRRLQPYMLALFAGYVVGLLSLSRCYNVPTQFILALGTAYLVIVGRSGANVIRRFDAACARRVSAVGLLFLLAVYVFLRLMLVERVAS
jgi:O-antigen ligase